METQMSPIAIRFFERDLAECIRQSDARKAENEAAKVRMQANASLCAILLEDARRRGQSAIDWPEYFRNIGL